MTEPAAPAATDTPAPASDPTPTPPEGGDTPPAEPAAPADGTVLTDGQVPNQAPEEYADFNLPDGIELNEGLLESSVPVFKEVGLTQIQAQRLVDMFSGHVQAETQAQTEFDNQLRTELVETAKKDPEIGGDKFDQTISNSQAVLDKLGTPAFLDFLTQSGAGNHPEMIRFISRVYPLTQEDSPGTPAQPTTEEQSQAGILYPNLVKKTA